MGELYSNQRDPKFVGLVESGVKLQLDDLMDFRRELQESRGYHQFCSETIRQSWLKPIFSSGIRIPAEVFEETQHILLNKVNAFNN